MVSDRQTLVLRVLQVATATLTVGWVYASYRNDVLNVGGGIGDVDLWLTIRDVFVYAFLASWAVLLVATGRLCWAPVGSRVKVMACGFALVIPPAMLLMSSWWFHRGFPPSPV